MLCDSHCHLDSFDDAAKTVSAAQDAGVGKILTNATSLRSIKSSLVLAKKHPAVKCALGIHPVDLLAMPKADAESAFAIVEGNISAASAIGEVGMDFKRAQTPAQRGLQEGIFRRFISLAIRHDRAIVVHARWAEPQCLSILEEMGACRVHMHWFTNSAKNAARAVKLGYRISCGPIIFSDSPSAEIVKGIPLDSLMLETDAPVEFAGARSEPSWIPRVCEAVSQLKGVPEKEVAFATAKSFFSLFG